MWLWRATGIQKLGMLSKNKSIHCGNPCFFSAQKPRKSFWSFLCHTLEHDRKNVEIVWTIWQQQCEAADMLFCKVVFFFFFKKKKVICEQCNNSLDRNQNNLQYLFYFPSATTYVTTTRSEKNQNVHSSLPHATEIAENIYIEHAKKLWSGECWDKYSKLIPTPVAPAVFRVNKLYGLTELDFWSRMFGTEHTTIPTVCIPEVFPLDQF